jgi:hypothetical protein
MATTPVTPVGYSTPYNSTTTQNSGLGAAAAPYGQDVLAQSYALASQDPFHAYTGQTVAGPTGLQQTAADSVSGLDAGALAKQGTALTTQGANYTPTNATFGADAAQQYMNPYQQNVTDIANREAARSSGIQANTDASRAAQAGAFGGSRQGVVDAERERNLGLLQNNTMQGQAAAFANAQQQFNADQTRNQQSNQFASQAALAGGNALTAQGQQAFGQQQTAGAQQQAAAQGNLTQDKANFMGEIQHPYDQLNFMTNQIKAMPGSSTSTSTQYTPDNTAAQPTGVQQAGGVLSGLAGALGTGVQLWDNVSKLWAGKEGGMVPTAAERSGLPQARIAQLYGAM